MTEHAQAVIIGGGVGGTSVAYHLAKLGWRDIVLVEWAELTSGSTFHSAGLVGQLRSSVTLTKIMMYGTDLCRRLSDETGVDPSWHEVGSVRLASSKARMEELERQAGWAKTYGLPMDLIDAQEAQDRFPLMSTEGVVGGVWLPADGWLDPSGLCLVLDDPLDVCLGNEPVRIDGAIVGRVTSGGQGFAVEQSIAYAYLPPDLAIGTRGEVELFGRWVRFEVMNEPLYDAANARIRS